MSFGLSVAFPRGDALLSWAKEFNRGEGCLNPALGAGA